MCKECVKECVKAYMSKRVSSRFTITVLIHYNKSNTTRIAEVVSAAISRLAAYFGDTTE